MVRIQALTLVPMHGRNSRDNMRMSKNTQLFKSDTSIVITSIA